MIDTLTLPRDRFDLAAFIGAYLASPMWDDPNHACGCLTYFQDWRAVPMPNHDLVDPLELLEAGHKVHFPMHVCPVDDTFLAISGDTLDSDDLDVGIGDTYGWVAQIIDERFELHPSQYDANSGPFPRTRPDTDCSIVQPLMLAFVRQFIRPESDAANSRSAPRNHP